MANNLRYVPGRVIIKVDLESKNWHTFSNGVKIRRERQFNELNRRISEPVNAFVVSGENIPEGVEILIHPNGVHDSNKIFNYRQLSGEETGSDIKYYSIPQEQCFLWKDENDVWQPIEPFATALKVYEPYKGVLTGIDPTVLKNTLYVTSGKLKDKVVKTIKAADYEIIFQGADGKEDRLIRFRPFGDEKNNREEEAICVLEDITKKVKMGKYLVGLSPTQAKSLNENVSHPV